MSLFDENHFPPPDQAPSSAPPSNPGSIEAQPPPTHAELPLAGDPISLAATVPAAVPVPSFAPFVPDDLRISWSWRHLLVFLLFAIASQFVVGIGAFAYYSMERHLSQAQLLKVLATDPKALVGTTILWFALMLLFLYVTLSVLREAPFWSSLGWRKLGSNSTQRKALPWLYFISGTVLSLLVAIAGSHVKDPGHTPIEEFFKSRTGAILLMSMAVFVAPLVEETLFRGYLYPVLARIISSIARFLGVEALAAFRTGVASSIFLTGVLFGLLHAPQLGWTLGLVSLLVFVGIVFTIARAWTGTVVASFLLHLGYNSFLAVTSVIATKGFTQMPPGN